MAHPVQTYTGTVTNTVVKNYDSSSKYLVFVHLTNGQNIVLEDTDTVLFWKFNSSDIYGEIQQGHKYTFTAEGRRSGFMSWYPNILSVKAAQ